MWRSGALRLKGDFAFRSDTSKMNQKQRGLIFQAKRGPKKSSRSGQFSREEQAKLGSEIAKCSSFATFSERTSERTREVVKINAHPPWR
jgi:hypothetical protein